MLRPAGPDSADTSIKQLAEAWKVQVVRSFSEQNEPVVLTSRNAPQSDSSKGCAEGAKSMKTNEKEALVQFPEGS